MVFEQEAYIGGSELYPVGDPTHAPYALLFKQDGMGGGF
jgi:hypothetical protein